MNENNDTQVLDEGISSNEVNCPPNEANCSLNQSN